MQHSSYEIKEKLLQALDSDYNVVDMDTVLDVITALEKAIITKEALEKTRIGKYINELRKRTKNEHLARRAKELVKSWRRLIPQSSRRVNGEETRNSVVSSPGIKTVLGPGPGPGIGPGPGPGNRIIKSVSVPGTQRFNTSSPSIMIERSSSPYFSSASNSPLLNSTVFQGTSLLSMPSNYAPIKPGICPIPRTEANSVNKTLLNVNNQSKNMTSSQHQACIKPVSPSVLKQDIVTSCEPSILPTRTSLGTSPGLGNSSNSSSPSLNTSVNVCSQNVSSPATFLVTHSSLDLAKTNAANKRLRKEKILNCAMTTESPIKDSRIKIGNGMSDVSKSNLPNESSAFNSVTSGHSNYVEGDTTLPTTVRNPKRKRSFDKKNELQENRLGDMLTSLQSSSKLPKVKTTQQLIADLQAKKGFNTVLSPASLTSVDSLQSSEVEVSRTKSELMKKFITSQSASSESNRESPVDETSISVSELGSHSVPDFSNVINTNLEVSSSLHHLDPVDEEINRILSSLPPLNPADIKPDTSFSSVRQMSVTDDDLNRLNNHRWEYVNGVYDCNGIWRSWQECTEQKSYMEESFQILPYVNID